MNKKEWLDKLYYDYDNQQGNLEVAYTYLDNGEKKFSKWRKFIDVQGNEDFLARVNNRRILPNEVVLDIDEPERFSDISEAVKEDFEYYSTYSTGSRGYHIHLWFDEKLTSDEKRFLIKKYKTDEQKATNRCLIALENEPHWKTGKPKTLIENKEGINSAEKVRKEYLDKKVKDSELIPYFYDSNRIWWLWDEKDFCWKMSDDIDILNMYKAKTNEDIISSKNRQEILNSLKQDGRKNKPLITPKSWIQFKESIVDISTGERFVASPKHFVTNPLPFKLGISEETPTIDRLFRDWAVCQEVQDESYVQTLYEIVAYSCYQEQFLQMMVALAGSGSNGKGTFLNLIAKFLGEKNVCSSNLRTLSTRNFEASALYRKLVCFFGEVDSYDLANTNLIKSLTGEDLIRYEFKGKTPFSEHSPTTPIIASNSLPITPDKSIGFYRRWLIVDFPNQFKVKRNLLKEIPDEEFENLGLKVVRILQELIVKNEFTNSGTIDERINRYEQRSHPLISFLNQSCEEGEGTIRLREFGEEFNRYLQDKRLRPYTINKIGKMLREEGYEIGARHIDGKTVSAKSIINLRWNKGSIIKNSSSGSTPELPKLPNSDMDSINFQELEDE